MGIVGDFTRGSGGLLRHVFERPGGNPAVLSGDAARLWRAGKGLDSLAISPAAQKARESVVSKALGFHEEAAQEEADSRLAEANFDTLGLLQPVLDTVTNRILDRAAGTFARRDTLDGIQLGTQGAERLQDGMIDMAFGNENRLGVSLVNQDGPEASPVEHPFLGFVIGKPGSPRAAKDVFTSPLLLGKDGGIWIQPHRGGLTPPPAEYYLIGRFNLPPGGPKPGQRISYAIDSKLLALDGNWSPELGSNLTVRAESLGPAFKTFEGFSSGVPDSVVEADRNGHPGTLVKWLQRETDAERAAGVLRATVEAPVDPPLIGSR